MTQSAMIRFVMLGPRRNHAYGQQNTGGNKDRLKTNPELWINPATVESENDRSKTPKSMRQVYHYGKLAKKSRPVQSSRKTSRPFSSLQQIFCRRFFPGDVRLDFGSLFGINIGPNCDQQ